MITIRSALPEDLTEVFRMGMEFLETHPVGPYDEEYMVSFLTHVIEKGIAFVADINGHICGMLLAVEGPALFNPAVTVVQEIAWWVDADARSAGVGTELLDMFESVVDGKTVIMGTMPTTNIERDWFAQRGWTLTHEVWTKGFGRA